ncbi:hypothetical protein L6164_036979 [Bauhinia variegata]|uniref:Uncharacterized protein n=1 Tax=Bauhinia variegata TaxID=167791 RepID=A0ACB9KIU3_BAUVA|nr:hypothetical protein L6164_036979 [Bauhinia variegata]
MEAIIKVLSTVLILGLITRGNGQCVLSDLKVSQSQTGASVEGKPEWSVVITNSCSCVQKDVKLNCQGFQTKENVDPSILSVSGDTCLVNNGNPIYNTPINFKYAWDNSFPLNPISSTIACS